MSKEYPLYPELKEEAKKEADLIMESFGKKLKKIADETLSELYVSCVDYIESDSWQNFRNDLLEGFKDYRNRKIHGEYDFKEIRTQIYKEYREEIIKDLNKDLILENEILKKRVESLLKERVKGAENV